MPLLFDTVVNVVLVSFFYSLFAVSAVIKPAPTVDISQDNLPVTLMPVSTVCFVMRWHPCVWICCSCENVWLNAES